MICLTDNIKIGHRIEKVYDIMDGIAPFSVDDRQVDGCYIVRTNLGETMLTYDTQVMRTDGRYIRVDQIRPFTQCLKHVSGPAVVVDVIAVLEPQWMVKVWDTDYIIVNGFYIAPDM